MSNFLRHHLMQPLIFKILHIKADQFDVSFPIVFLFFI